MKKIIFIVLVLFLVGCNKTTEIPSTNAPSTVISTTITITDVTTIINDEIYLRLFPGDDTIDLNQTWIDMGAFIVINDVEFAMSTVSTVDSSTSDFYQIIYTYEYKEEIYSIVRYVAVLDQTAPVVSLNPGIDTVLVNGTWLDAGVETSDNSGEEVEITITGSVDTSTVGTYEITYLVTDSSLNTTSITRYVNVIE